MANETKNTNVKRAFAKGMRELRVKDVEQARTAIISILGVTTMQSFRNYANGRVETLDVEKAKQIEALFASYGVNNPWGL